MFKKILSILLYSFNFRIKNQATEGGATNY